MSIAKYLDSKCKNGEIISVFGNPNDSYSAVVGYLVACDEKFFVLQHVTEHGRYDGYVLRRKDQVFRMDEKTSYETSLQKLYEYYGESHDEFVFDGDLLAGFLSFAKAKQFVIGIGVKDYDSSSILGYVDFIDVQGETVVVHQINDQGLFDGFSTVVFDSIVRISCDCEKDAALKALHSVMESE